MIQSRIRQTIWENPPLSLAVTALVVFGLVVYWTGYNTGFDRIDPLKNSSDETRIYRESFTMLDDPGIHRDLQGYPPAVLWVHRAAQLLTPTPQQPQPVAVVTYVRLWNGILNLFTIIGIVLVGRRLHSDAAGIIAASAWLFAPLIVSRVNVALTEPGQAFFVIFSLYFATQAIDRASPHAAVVSGLMALGATLFKYSAASALGFGIGAALWHLRTDWRKWSLALAVQAVLIVVTAYLLFAVFGAGALTDNPEIAAFLGSGEAGISLSLFGQAFDAAAQQIGWGVLPLLAVYGAGSVLYVRSQSPQRRYIWLMMSVYVLVYLAVMLTYIVFWLGVHRYILTITPVLVLLMSISLAQLVTAILDWARIKDKTWQTAAITLCAVVWIGPLAVQTVKALPERSRPRPEVDLMMDFVDWTAKALPEGTIRVPGYNNVWSFFDSWWGYVGPQRPWVADDDITQRTPEEWRSIHVRYVYLSEDERAELLATQEQYLNQMLLLRRFPPLFYVYSMDAIENRVDATFGSQITLLGYNQRESGETLQIEPFWQPSGATDRDYQVFVHVVPLSGDEIVAQDDGTPALPTYPTSQWSAGEIVIGQPRTIRGLPNGQYRILLGLYDLQTGARLPTADGRDFVLLDTIE